MSKFCAMKKFYNLLLFAAVCISLSPSETMAQCGSGYTQAQLNWDNLDYYYNSGSGAPYTNYIKDTREMSQKFGIGSNWLTIATSNNAIIAATENASHTGDITGYTGEDMQYTFSSIGQTITITFNNPVLDAKFTLYDIDRGGAITVSAADPSSLPLTVAAATQGTTILTVTGAVSKTMTDLTNTTLGNTDNRGTVTITVAGSASNPVKSITITATTLGADAKFWLSDINACVTGSFPTNWHQGFNNQPFQGFTQNQPDYFLITPDNNSCYMMNPANGNCWYLFTDASKTYMNSFAYDPDNKILYYISENTSLNANWLRTGCCSLRLNATATAAATGNEWQY